MPIPLAAVVQNSPTIVVVDDADPAFRDIEVPAGSVPLATRLTRARVVEVLRAPAGQVSAGRVIEVAAAHLDSERMAHQMYYDEGIAESPIYEVYEAGAPNTGRRVLLLQPCAVPGHDVGLCFSATGAVVSASGVDAVRQLLAAQ